MSTGSNSAAGDRTADQHELPARIAAPAVASDQVASDQVAAEAEDALARAYRERDEYRDLLLRKTAEFDNYRKRVERERREQAAVEVADLIESLLTVLDDFERALRIEEFENAEAYRAGVELIHRQLLDVLARRGVTPIDALGADFDPRLHQAVMTEDSPGHRDGEVIEELRRGYRIGERLVRPAMVKVAKA